MPPWYYQLQGYICLFFGSILFGMYLRGVPKETPRKGQAKDTGILFLSVSVLIWAIVGFIGPRKPEFFNTVVRSFLSIANSAFIVLSVAYIDHAPEGIRVLLRQERWRNMIIAVFLMAAFVCGIFDEEPKFTKILDFALSEAALVLLGVSLFLSYKERKFRTLAALSAAVIIGTLWVQKEDLRIAFETLGSGDSPPEDHIVNLLITKLCLIGIILSLPMTWAVEAWEAAVELRRDLHGSILQKAAAVQLSIEGHSGHKSGKADQIRQLEEIQKELRDIVDGNYSGDSPGDLQDAITELSSKVLMGGVKCEINIEDGLNRLPNKTKYQIVKVVRDSFSNISQHSEAKKVTIKGTIEHKEALLSITDDGKGFKPAEILEISKGHGIRNMRGRIEELGGRFEISSKQNMGTIILIGFPFPG